MPGAPIASLIEFTLRALAAFALVTAGSFVSYACSAALLPRRPTLLRWTGTIVAGLWIANASFHLLAAFRAFTLPAALVGAAILAAIASRGQLLRTARAAAAADRRAIALLRRKTIPAHRLCLIGAFCLFAALLVIRTFVVQPLSWDTLTYHAVKSGLWVQNAGALPLRTPGGWSAYRNYFGGGEILWAWAMLPFHADTLALVVDAVEWLALGLALMALARELGVREPFASAQAGFVLMVPTFQLLLGSGYVELALNLAFVSGMAFAVRFLRRPAPVWLIVALAGLGVAAAVKVTALPLLAVMFVILVLRAAFLPNAMRQRAKGLLVGSAAAAVMVLPWLVNNVQESGYPLSPMPIKVAGITLGEANEAITWYDQRPDLKSNRQSEMLVLEKIFRLPPARIENLGGVAAVPVVLFPLAIAAIARSSRATAAALLALAVAICAGFYSPAFRTVRLGWSVSASRFVMPLVCFAAASGAAWCRKIPFARRAYFAFLGAGLLYHAALMAMVVWAPLDARPAIISFALVTLMTALAMTARFRALAPAARIAVTLVAAIGSLYAVNVWRERHRYDMARDTTVLHFIPRYWVKAAESVDTPEAPRRIAVTAGPKQTADNWFLYYFLGRKLQNELVHVPPSGDGHIEDFGGEQDLSPSGDEQAWLQRLAAARVSHVMSFAPQSLELTWMEQRPEKFQRVVGAPGRWGLFALTAEAR